MPANNSCPVCKQANGRASMATAGRPHSHDLSDPHLAVGLWMLAGMITFLILEKARLDHRTHARMALACTHARTALACTHIPLLHACTHSHRLHAHTPRTHSTHTSTHTSTHMRERFVLFVVHVT